MHETECAQQRRHDQAVARIGDRIDALEREVDSYSWYAPQRAVLAAKISAYRDCLVILEDRHA